MLADRDSGTSETATCDRRLLAIFLELVRIDATSGREGPVAEYVRGFLADLGLEPRIDGAGAGTTYPACGNVVCPIGDGGELVVAAHLDTARPTRAVEPRVDGERVTSSGDTILGADNRAGCAAILWAAERALAEGAADRDLTLLFTVREEVDLHGAKNAELPSSIDSGIVLDSSERPGRMVHRAWGLSSFEVEIAGRASHAGLAPEDGVNALLIAAAAISETPFGRLDDDTVANLGRLEGGGALNVVPERAVAAGEVRSLRAERIEEVLAAVAGAFDLAAAAAGGQCRFTARREFDPYDLPLDAPVCTVAARALRAAGLEVEACGSAGGSDANALNARGIATVNLGIGAQRPHADDEFIRLADLAATGRVALELIRG